MPFPSSPKDKRFAFFCSFWICSRLVFPLISSRKSSMAAASSGFPRPFRAYSCTSFFFRRWETSDTDSNNTDVSDGCPRMFPERKDCSRILSWAADAGLSSPAGSVCPGSAVFPVTEPGRIAGLVPAKSPVSTFSLPAA